jgi:hypothetical protein
MDTGQKTESIARLVDDILRDHVALPEFQRDFVWDVEKTFDLFDSFVRDIFTGSLIYGTPSFEITVRELDRRPRAGKGSRARLKLTSFTKSEIERRVKVSGFRLLLDGQQRATSIFRAMLGIDPVYFVLLNEDELPKVVRETPIGQRGLEDVLAQFQGEPDPSRASINLRDVYRVLTGDISREREKAELFLVDNSGRLLEGESVDSSETFSSYLTQLRNLENLCRQEKLVAYYLLDTDEEKFALFFERSNSKGIQLNFIDILAAKLYSGFNLRAAVQRYEEDHPDLPLNREVVTRVISFEVSGGRAIDRSYILSNLTHQNFNSLWDKCTAAYSASYRYLLSTRLLIHPSWIPYENILLPLTVFAAALPHHDFSQITSDQAIGIRVWYWAAIFSRRYSSAAQTYSLNDAQALSAAAQMQFTRLAETVSKMQIPIQAPDDLLLVRKKYDAVYKGVLNLINFSAGGFLNFDNGDPASHASNLEDHHIFPRDYLRRKWSDVNTNLDPEMGIDCVVNRTLIPKLTNIKVGNKAPSVYLGELMKKNPRLPESFPSHLLSVSLLNGEYDGEYDYFLAERADEILSALRKNVIQARDSFVAQFGEATRPLRPVSSPAGVTAPA